MRKRTCVYKKWRIFQWPNKTIYGLGFMPKYIRAQGMLTKSGFFYLVKRKEKSQKWTATKNVVLIIIGQLALLINSIKLGQVPKENHPILFIFHKEILKIVFHFICLEETVFILFILYCLMIITCEDIIFV